MKQLSLSNICKLPNKFNKRISKTKFKIPAEPTGSAHFHAVAVVDCVAGGDAHLEMVAVPAQHQRAAAVAAQNVSVPEEESFSTKRLNLFGPVGFHSSGTGASAVLA